MRVAITVAASLVLIAASCSPGSDVGTTPREARPLTAAGESAQLQPTEADANLAWAASVVELDQLANEANGGVKLFGLAGGDPAMNGLHTYIAFFENPGSGWQVFRLGDFLNYRVLSETPGRVDLEIAESTMDDTGNIGSRTRHIIVSWTRGDDDAPPQTISITPAEQQR